MQQFGARIRLNPAAPLLDHAQAEVDVPEEAAFVGLPERGARGQLGHAADVVEERRGKQKVATQSRMQLGRLTTDRRHAHGVLEQAAGI
jgi:hypothetical protein